MSLSHTQTIDTWLATHAAHQPDKVALRCGGKVWSYKALHQWVQEMAAGLVQTYGLTRGDRVAYLGQNSAAELALFFAAARLGLIMVPLNWRLAPDELSYAIENAGARLLVYGGEQAEVATCLGADQAVPSEALPRATPTDLPAGRLGDPFLIVYTSGTTGRPKGAVLTQEAVFWNALISQHAQDLTAADHVLNVLPLFHVGGINIQVMPAFYIGATVTLHSLFAPQEVISALEDDGITTTVCVPAMMKALMAHPAWAAARFPDLRLLNTGSTDVPVEILRDVNARGIPMVQVYGATETGPVSTYQRADEAQTTLGSIGRPGAHVQVRIVADGRDCAVDEPGEIWIKAPNTFSHYWQNPQATNAALEDGWFKTGDVALRDAQGLLWFVGRIKHVIISGGENIYPAEIERILAVLPGLREVAVVGRPDPHWGEVPVVVAAIEADGPTEDVILGACTGIARFKRPKDVVLVRSLPRNAMGKVVLEEVRKIATAAPAEVG